MAKKSAAVEDPDLKTMKAAAKVVSDFIKKFAKAKPIIKRLQAATSSRKVAAINKATVALIDFQADACSKLVNLPFPMADLARTLSLNQRLRQAIVDGDEAERAVVQAEILGHGFEQICGLLNSMGETISVALEEIKALEA